MIENSSIREDILEKSRLVKGLCNFEYEWAHEGELKDSR